ncbi:MAG: alpha/beta hydrolase [Verrucomicrobia bacterium]|nr:alpha/beta hydrolase [Verrucomicrobiota bacterium]
MSEELSIRIHGDASLPTLVYLPGIHGDWTLVASFRAALAGRVRFVEFTYPRTLTWSLDDYADAIKSALAEHGIACGCVLAESFGSQVAWQLIGKNDRVFKADSLILAGGFVRYPTKWNVRLARRICRGVSMTSLTRFLFCYARYAKFRHRHAPETLASLAEFLERRTELDRQAAVHRLDLISANDPRPIANRVTLPVYSLTGFFDPIVPWWRVRPWLRANCPGYRAGKIILRADHNVLGTAPRAAAAIVEHWIRGGKEASD